jgi:hypothetical protein
VKLLAALALVLALPAFAGAEPITGRIAASNDGNASDCDSIASSAVEIALIAASGNAAKLVWYGYSDIPWETSGQCGSGGDRDAQMRTSVVGTAALWGGFDGSVFHSVVSDQAAAVNALKDAIDASSASSPLYITEGAPCDTIGKAIDAASPSKLPYVYVITHSDWNDTTSHNGSWTRSAIAKAHPNVHWIQIPDQNAELKSPKRDYHAWRDSKVPAVRRLWDRQAASGQSQFDISDSGMTYYLVTGRTVSRPTPQQVIALVDAWQPTLPGACGQPSSRGAQPLASDALQILRGALGIVTCVECVCDVDRSSTITTTDALKVLKRAVGQHVALSCPECPASTTSMPAAGEPVWRSSESWGR